MPKQVNVKIFAPDAELEFSIQPSTTGNQLFDQVAKTVGEREVWYFGISYVDTKGNSEWIKLNKKVLSQNIKKENPLLFHLEIKFFPEDVSEELIQAVTKKYFFLHVKNAILNEHIYCPPETCVLLASYACQVKYGDYENENQVKDNEKLLPARVVDQHKLTREQWKEKIVAWWREHRDMLREDAMVEYLKIVQDLDMYGVNYFDIKNKKGTTLRLGVDALGLNVYDRDDKLTPKIGFPWSEIRNISFSDKKFTIKPVDKKAPDFVFYTNKVQTNKRILSLCMGNHELYVRRRKPETIEIQQMKAQVKEEKEEKITERRQRVKEREEKEAFFRQKEEAEEQLRIARELNEEAKRKEREAEENLQRIQKKMEEEKEENERKVKYLEEKLREQQEYEANLQFQMNQIQQDLQATKEEHAFKTAEERERNEEKLQKLEEERKQLQEKIYLADMERKRHREQYEQIGKEYELTRQQLARQSSVEYKMKNQQEVREVSVEDEVTVVVSADMQHSENIQGNRSEEDRETHVGGNKSKQKMLLALSADLKKELKDSQVTQEDIIYAQNQEKGRDKYKTLKQIRSGNTKQRIDQFEST